MKFKKIDFTSTDISAKALYTMSGIFFAAGIVIILWFGFRYYKMQKMISSPAVSGHQAHDSEFVAVKCDYQRWFDGACVASEAEQFPQLAAVMIENHTEARPMSGLAKAAIVYEAPVEAMFTRFMAIYLIGEDVDKAGPVRSARPYYVDWSQEYGNIMYVHVGGSPEALNLIGRKTIFNINEMYKGNFFWRSSDRFAPHNTYTSAELWNKALEANILALPPKELKKWNFAYKQPCAENCVQNITISFLRPSYVAVWEYNSEQGNYLRYQSGFLHKDQDGTQIIADTIIVQRISYSVLDEVGRLRMDTIGSGEALVFRDGYIAKGTWRKSGFGERTEWFDENGQPMELKAGKIWIEVVPEGKSVNYELRIKN